MLNAHLACDAVLELGGLGPDPPGFHKQDVLQRDALLSTNQNMLLLNKLPCRCTSGMDRGVRQHSLPARIPSLVAPASSQSFFSCSLSLSLSHLYPQPITSLDPPFYAKGCSQNKMFVLSEDCRIFRQDLHGPLGGDHSTPRLGLTDGEKHFLVAVHTGPPICHASGIPVVQKENERVKTERNSLSPQLLPLSRHPPPAHKVARMKRHCVAMPTFLLCMVGELALVLMGWIIAGAILWPDVSKHAGVMGSHWSGCLTKTGHSMLGCRGQSVRSVPLTPPAPLPSDTSQT
ncbi:hypothetical protein JZ751_025069 [Albula glossodonta]|uniref:Uncharacterized protein n=1 Tax=Albula glossodonta TaxID=121402 RepID=A0A8T2PG93_9TELE|nr:hypothetical protein JZ751_025069 [Albula glossodonta]